MYLSDTVFQRLRSPWLCGMVLIGLTVLFLYVDRPLLLLLASQDLGSHWPFLHAITRLGKGWPYMGLFLGLALWFRYIQINALWERRAWFLWLCVMIPNVIGGVLKIGFGRARPLLWLQDDAYGFYWLQTKSSYWSFPSGHATTVMGVAMGLSLLFPRYVLWFLSTAGLVIFSRLALLQHYLSDVLMAAYLVMIEVGLLVYVLRKKRITL